MRIPVVFALLASTLLMAGEFDQLASELKKNWPGKTHIGVVCNQENSKAKIQALATAFGAASYKITVFDVRSVTEIGKTVPMVTSKHPDFIVLIPGDNVAGDGSSAVGFLVQRLCPARIPVVCTTESGLKQGACFAAGPGTGGKAMGNPKTASVAGLTLPAGI